MPTRAAVSEPLGNLFRVDPQMAALRDDLAIKSLLSPEGLHRAQDRA